MLKAIGLLDSVPKMFSANDNEVVEVYSKVNKIIVNSYRNLMYMPNIGTTKKPNFLALNVKKTLNYL